MERVRTNWRVTSTLQARLLHRACLRAGQVLVPEAEPGGRGQSPCVCEPGTAAGEALGPGLRLHRHRISCAQQGSVGQGRPHGVEPGHPTSFIDLRHGGGLSSMAVVLSDGRRPLGICSAASPRLHSCTLSCLLCPLTVSLGGLRQSQGVGARLQIGQQRAKSLDSAVRHSGCESRLHYVVAEGF